MNPSQCSISDSIEALNDLADSDEWRSNLACLTLMQTIIADLFLLDDGFLTDEEDSFVKEVFLLVLSHDMRNTR